MPEIVLVRHGMPICDHETAIRGCDFTQWVEAYDQAPLDRRVAPPAHIVFRAAASACIVASTLRRSIESAEWIAPARTITRDPMFDEAGIPTGFSFRTKLRPAHWDGLARAAWLVGWSNGGESANAAKQRADRATDELVRLASAHRSTMLVGHGMLNTLIARALRKRGWSGAGAPRDYWGIVAIIK